MLKKLVLNALVFAVCGCGVSFANDYVTRTEFNQVANDVYDLHNDQLLLHLQQQKELEQIKKGMQDISNLQYDDTQVVKQIDAIKQEQNKLQGQVQNNTTLLNSVQEQLNTLNGDYTNFKHETRKGIASAIAIASLEKPAFDIEHKTSIMIGTGTYKGTASIAYGITYQPNYDMVFSIKGSDDSVGCSIGINL